MSATLTWFNSGLGAKTGTTDAALIDDLVALFNSKSGDANFSWQVASSNSATSPNYIVLKRKSGAAGRILLLNYTSAPAGQPANLFDQAPTVNNLYGSYFPAGNVDTPSNLTASSGTVLGNDTGAIKVWASAAVVSLYAANVQPFYFDSAEAVYFGWQNPAAAQLYLAAAGFILVDQADQEYAAVMGFGTGSAAGFGGITPPMTWAAAKPNAGSGTPCVRTNYGSTDRVYAQAWAPNGAWTTQAVGASDLLSDTTISRAYFLPFHLLGQIKGEGFVLKLRQIAIGPQTTGPFTPYNTTGPVVAARQFNGATAGGNGYPWLTNFKV
jgi:hypothetical protein